MLKKEERKIDFTLAGLIIFLVLWGLFSMGTISFPLSLENYGNPWYYFIHQLIMVLIGGAGFFLFLKIPLEKIKKMAPYLFLASLILAILVFLPKIGVKSGGAQRWLSFWGISFQPAEFLKISFLLYLSAWLSEKIKNQKKQGDLVIFATFLTMLLILFLILIFQRDMTTLIIISLIGLIVYFSASTPLWQSFFIAGAGVSILFFFIKFIPYRLARILVFLNPKTEPFGIGYHLNQSLIAIGSGKFWGIDNGFGFGLSRQKFDILPHPMTDSIFAIIGEELGFVGAIFLIALFLFLGWRGLKIARNSPDNFCKLAALGLTSWIVIQSFLNIGGIIGIVPMGGVPLPFFSYGGSHLIAELAAMGILLNISKNQEELTL